MKIALAAITNMLFFCGGLFSETILAPPAANETGWSKNEFRPIFHEIAGEKLDGLESWFERTEKFISSLSDSYINRFQTPEHLYEHVFHASGINPDGRTPEEIKILVVRLLDGMFNKCCLALHGSKEKKAIEKYELLLVSLGRVYNKLNLPESARDALLICMRSERNNIRLQAIKIIKQEPVFYCVEKSDLEIYTYDGDIDVRRIATEIYYSAADMFLDPSRKGRMLDLDLTLPAETSH